MKLALRSSFTILLPAIAALSLAAPKLTLEIQAYASSSRQTTTDQQDDHHTYVGPAFLSATANAMATGGGTGIGHAIGNIDFGAIHGLVSGTATYGSALPFIVNSAGGFGTFTGVYEDTITIKSATLPLGTPVALKQTLHAHGFLDRSGSYSSLSYFARVGGLGGLGDMYVYQNLNQNDLTASLVIQEDQVRTVMVKVGDVLPVFGQLELIAVSSADPTKPSSFAQIDAMNTMGEMFDVTTPGAYFTSASGAHYTAVPEPASIAVLAIGAVSLLRRRKK